MRELPACLQGQPGAWSPGVERNRVASAFPEKNCPPSSGMLSKLQRGPNREAVCVIGCMHIRETRQGVDLALSDLDATDYFYGGVS